MIASVVVAAALISALGFDGDAQGEGTLAWSAYRGRAFEIRALDLADRRPHVLYRGDSVSNLELSDFDVSPGGAAVACLRDRVDEFRRTWKLRIVRRLPGRPWSAPILVSDPHQWIEKVSCGIGDAGQVTVAWLGWRASPKWRTYATTVGADGRIEPPVLLARDTLSDPQALVASDGTGTVGYAREQGPTRVLALAQHPPAGPWTTRVLAPAFSAKFALDGTGRVLAGWDTDEHPQLASGPAFTSAPLTYEPGTNLVDLTAGARGDVLATWVSTHQQVRVGLQRPGAPFANPVTLGRVRDFELAGALAADGTGAVTWLAHDGTTVTRKLTADGHWNAPIRAGGSLVAGPGGRVTAAWIAHGRSGRDTLQVASL